MDATLKILNEEQIARYLGNEYHFVYRDVLLSCGSTSKRPAYIFLSISNKFFDIRK